MTTTKWMDDVVVIDGTVCCSKGKWKMTKMDPKNCNHVCEYHEVEGEKDTLIRGDELNVQK